MKLFVRIFLYIFLCASVVFGAVIKDAKVSIEQEGLELTISLDSPFNGKISEKREDSQISLVIDGLTSSSPYMFAPKSDLVSALRIAPREKEQTIVRIQPKTAILVEARAIGDGKTVLIRLNADGNSTAIIPPQDPFENSYILAVIFVSSIALLWILLRLMRSSAGGGSWLMGKKTGAISIIWQKPIDTKNRFVFAKFRDKEYLLVIGQNNILIDTLGGEKRDAPIDTDSFEAMLKANSVKLSDFLKQSK
ncbi:membrane protein [Campylobacterota bacterium]|nr:membrane protein [Campylobacterota bacterium]